ncbi:MAG: CheY-like chemotaxis protein [Chlamydiales bacterium]|jgi:CheY-like chemotaxis protein
MREHLNRVLLALIAQASTDAGTSLSEGFTRAADAGQAARHEALQCLLFDQHSGGEGIEFSVRETVHAAIEECRRLLPAHIEVSGELYDGADRVVGDSTALRELVTLLFAHAQHALGNRAGRLSFHMDRVEGARAANECPGLEAGTHARLRITIEHDRSVAERHGSALDALFQAWPSPNRRARADEGWNLGLSLARKAAWTLGGRCCGTCAADEAVCTVYLPLAARLQARSSGAGLGPGLGLAVLYVSGEEAILSMGRTSLIESDCCVSIACNGQDALRSLAVRAREIDLVVTEEFLDDMSGAALVSELQRRHNGLPALIAARPNRTARAKTLREYIMKPFSAGDLRSAAWMATAPDRRRPLTNA